MCLFLSALNFKLEREAPVFDRLVTRLITFNQADFYARTVGWVWLHVLKGMLRSRQAGALTRASSRLGARSVQTK